MAVRRSKIHRRGVFALCDLEAGDPVLTLGGELFTLGEAQSSKARIHSTTGFTDTLYIGTPAGRAATKDEFINHSCDPSLWLENDLTLIARRAIPCGGELTVDYDPGRLTKIGAW